MAGYDERRSMDARKGESSKHLCDKSLETRLADLVRGSSRRITIMPADLEVRSANIRMIHRRSVSSTFARRTLKGENQD